MSYTEIARRTQKARKPHNCTWCGQKINAGEQYVYVRCVFEGDPQSNHFHPECDGAVADAAREEGGSFEFFPGEGERPQAKP